MAEIRPFKALRYTDVAGSLSDLVAPPYDVISEERQRALYDRSEYNIVRVEYGETRPDDSVQSNRYTRAAAMVRAWREGGALAEDAEPALYVYAQDFDYAGESYRRTGVLAAVRLEPFESGIVKPHEFTMTGPKEDRFHLLQAVKVNTSPVFGMVRDREGLLRAFIDTVMREKPTATATDDLGQAHSLWRVADSPEVSELHTALLEEAIYIADGHHRYETALRYRDAIAPQDESHPANFVLMALVCANDPGLVIRPIHRLVNPANDGSSLLSDLARAWEVNGIVPTGGRNAVETVLRQMSAEGHYNTVFGMIRKSGVSRVSLRNIDAVMAHMPDELPDAARDLDVERLQHGILQPMLGIGAKQLASGDYVSFTEDAADAAEAVADGRCQVAFLINPTRTEQVLDVADAGARMPQKSTFFYPKLGTGLVMRSIA